MTTPFARTTTTRIEVTIYPNDLNEPGRFGGLAEDPTAIRVRSTRKIELKDKFKITWARVLGSIGKASATFALKVKTRENLDELILDDDGIDLTFLSADAPTEREVLRGRIDDVRLSEDSSGGATVQEWLIFGRSYGSVFEDTFTYFDMLTDGKLNAAFISDAIWANGVLTVPPDQFVQRLLAGFIGEANIPQVGRAVWKLPDGMPTFSSVATDVFRSFVWDARLFSGDLPRHAPVNPNLIAMPDTDVWSLAESWSDREITEMFTDYGYVDPPDAPIQIDAAASGLGAPVSFPTLPLSWRPAQPGVPLTKRNIFPTVVFRDRPTLRSDLADPLERWNKIPIFSIDSREKIRLNIARSGQNRMNAFYGHTRFVAEASGAFSDLIGPLWAPDDIKTHGFRRCARRTEYIPDEATSNHAVLSEGFRRRLRDINALRHLQWSGTIDFPNGRPDLTYGWRMRVERGRRPASFYVEGYEHTWTYDDGLQTQLVVTHGWLNTDDDLRDTFQRVIGRYTSSLATTEPIQPEPPSAIQSIEPPVQQAAPTPNRKPDPDDWIGLIQLEYGSPEFYAIFDQAVAAPFAAGVGAQTSWVRDPRFKFIYTRECRSAVTGKTGYVGLPNSIIPWHFYPKLDPNDIGATGWEKNVWDVLKRAKIGEDVFNNAAKAPVPGQPKTATGLGQMTLTNIIKGGPGGSPMYPSGVDGIGDALEEAIGVMRYIAVHVFPYSTGDKMEDAYQTKKNTNIY